MNIQRLIVGPLETNCYIAYTGGDKETEKTGVVIDPGADGERIVDFLKQERIRVVHILLTHVHFDHMLAVPEVQRATGADLMIPAGELNALHDPRLSLLNRGGQEDFHLTADRLLKDGDKVTAGPLSFTLLETPGHTAGSACYLADDAIFSGDTLFYRDIGRTDFPGGSFEDIKRSLLRLRDLPGDYCVLPGHGDGTTLAQERALNPYMSR